MENFFFSIFIEIVSKFIKKILKETLENQKMLEKSIFTKFPLRSKPLKTILAPPTLFVAV